MKYALIGCGRIAVNHIKAALANKLDIVGICDIYPEKMTELLSSVNIENSTNILKFTDYKKMLEETKPDFVSITTASGTHAPIALYCIDKGFHVIIEKPMAMNMTDADEIVRRSLENNIKVAACHQNRFNIAVQKMRKALEDGRFGKLSHGSVHVRWNRNKDYYKQASWRGTWKEDGGALMNQCIHGIDLFRWMLGGQIDTVYGVTRRQFHDYLECEDVGMAVVTFKNGAIGTIEGTTNVYPQNLEETLYLFGEKGTAKLGGKSCNKIDVWNFADEDAADKNLKDFEESMSNVYGNGHIALFADMIQAIKDDRPPYVDAKAGRDAVETVLAVYMSAKLGKPVKLPLNNVSSIDFEGRFD